MRLVGVSHLVEVLLGTQYLLPQCGALVFLLEGLTVGVNRGTNSVFQQRRRLDPLVVRRLDLPLHPFQADSGTSGGGQRGAPRAETPTQCGGGHGAACRAARCGGRPDPGLRCPLRHRVPLTSIEPRGRDATREKEPLEYLDSPYSVDRLPDLP